MDEPSTGLGTRLPPGWDDHWSGVWSSEQRSPLRPALVTRIDKGGITVSESRGEERLVIAAKGARRVVVGDMVALDADAGRIEEILPRRTVFERRSPGVARDQVQISSRPLASNMDTVLVLQPLERGVNLARLARELVLSWESGATPVVVLTKTDLVTAEDRESQRAAAQSFAPDTEVLCVSTRSEAGLAELESKIDTESVIALMGTSGAGKSSLVNTLAGRPVQLTADVRETDRRVGIQRPPARLSNFVTVRCSSTHPESVVSASGPLTRVSRRHFRISPHSPSPAGLTTAHTPMSPVVECCGRLNPAGSPESDSTCSTRSLLNSMSWKRGSRSWIGTDDGNATNGHADESSPETAAATATTTGPATATRTDFGDDGH
ncbi:MAG: GTPase RsgA [Microthrixaceae bacterium]